MEDLSTTRTATSGSRQVSQRSLASTPLSSVADLRTLDAEAAPSQVTPRATPRSTPRGSLRSLSSEPVFVGPSQHAGFSVSYGTRALDVSVRSVSARSVSGDLERRAALPKTLSWRDQVIPNAAVGEGATTDGDVPPARFRAYSSTGVEEAGMVALHRGSSPLRPSSGTGDSEEAGPPHSSSQRVSLQRSSSPRLSLLKDTNCSKLGDPSPSALTALRRNSKLGKETTSTTSTISRRAAPRILFEEVIEGSSRLVISRGASARHAWRRAGVFVRAALRFSRGPLLRTAHDSVVNERAALVTEARATMGGCLGGGNSGAPPLSRVTPYLLVGDHTQSLDAGQLLRYGVTHVINAAAHLPLPSHAHLFAYLHLLLADVGTQSLSDAFPRAIAHIADARARGGVVFVHCVAGISRSVTLTLAYLVATNGGGLTLAAAARRVAAARPQALPNHGFRVQLALWEIQQRGRSSVADLKPWQEHPRRNPLGWWDSCDEWREHPACSQYSSLPPSVQSS